MPTEAVPALRARAEQGSADAQYNLGSSGSTSMAYVERPSASPAISVVPDEYFSSATQIGLTATPKETNQARRSNRPRSQAPLPPAKCPPPFYNFTRTRRHAAPPKNLRPRNDDANARRHGLTASVPRGPRTPATLPASRPAATVATNCFLALCSSVEIDRVRSQPTDRTAARLAYREARGVRRARRAYPVRRARPGAAAPTPADRSPRPHQHSRGRPIRLQRLSRSGHGGDSAVERAGRSRGRQHAVARTRRDRRRLDRHQDRHVRYVLDVGDHRAHYRPLDPVGHAPVLRDEHPPVWRSPSPA